MRLMEIDMQDGGLPVSVAMSAADHDRLTDYLIAARNALLYRQDCIDALKGAANQLTCDGHSTGAIDDLLKDMGVRDG